MGKTKSSASKEERLGLERLEPKEALAATANKPQPFLKSLL